MSTITKLVLDYPPSANRYWRNFRGRMVRSREANDYKAQVAILARLSEPDYIESALVGIRLDLYRPQRSGDLDNRIKICLDALIEIAYADDKQVVEIHAYRHDDKANPRLCVQYWRVQEGVYILPERMEE